MCCETGCTNQRAPRSRRCHRCNKRRYKERHPKRYAYNVLKQNARRRGKEFHLTFEEFCIFCKETKYFYKKGIYKNSYHIDRKDETKGYTLDNIQVLTNSDNVRKYLKWSHREGKTNKFVVQTVNSNLSVEEDDTPF